MQVCILLEVLWQTSCLRARGRSCNRHGGFAWMLSRGPSHQQLRKLGSFAQHIQPLRKAGIVAVRQEKAWPSAGADGHAVVDQGRTRWM